MNGIAARGPNGYDGRAPVPRPLGALNGPVVVDAMSSPQMEKPRFNQVRNERILPT